MDRFLSIISDIRVVIVIAGIVFLLALWLIINKVRTNKLHRELEDLEAQYNKIKSIPLSFKMNKAVALGRVDQNTTRKVNAAKQQFDDVQASMKKISDNLADAEDYIVGGRLRKADQLLAEINPAILGAETSVNSLDNILEDILSKQTEQRQEVTTLKNRFRAMKSQAEENANRLSYVWPAVERNITNTERMFSTFEEWMYSSDFEKANAELDTIRMSMEDLNHMLTVYPDLIQDARGLIPKMAETMHREYNAAKNRGVYLKHLDIEKNMSVIQASLKEDLQKLKKGEDSGLADHFKAYKERIRQMSDSIKAESDAYNQISVISKQVNEIAEDAKKNADYINRQIKTNADKYGLKSYEETIARDTETLSTLEEKRPAVMDTVRNSQKPATETVSDLKQLYHDYSTVNEELKKIHDQIQAANGGEERAQRQLEKLQIIMNQLQVKIRKYKLPNISEKYQKDMARGNEYLTTLNNLIHDNPINLQLLNSTISEALDYIYKLYNNVNNVVGTVVMVENAIVFGNRYRSTYPDIDSELTRSELAFRNGEYTEALRIAIDAIEKIHPGNYEQKIKENAKSA